MATSRAVRRRSKAMAHAVKSGGGGATATGTRQTSMGLIDVLKGAAVGFITGGPGGAVAGGLAGLTGGGPSDIPSRGFQGTTCPPPRIRIGDSCFDPFALPPGGTPAVIPASGSTVNGGGDAVIGSFGMPAKTPRLEARTVRECGPGLVLGKDNLCYPRSVLRRNSRFRKWPQPARPPVTGADKKAIRRAARVREDVLELAKDVGLHASKSKPRSRSKK